jgi:recombination protein RecA
MNESIQRVKMNAAPAPAEPAVQRVKVNNTPILPPPSVRFTTSGSALLNLVLGGGWAQRRVVNIVGDKSSGKTLLAVEACANFALLFGVDSIRYVEAEAAFDEGYAATIGMPKGIKLESSIRTVEEWENDLVAWLDARPDNGKPCLYVLDSLDALSDSAEMARDNDKGSYGAAKAKQISEMFRKRIALIEKKNCTLFIISQIRDKIGVVFGETKQRSGGRALDFYASQVIWLAEVGKLKRTVLKAERVIGMKVLARTKKNKVAIPFREAELTIFFNYGIDDEISMLNWLTKHDAAGLLALKPDELKKALASCRQAQERDALEDIHTDLRLACAQHWNRIEALLAPPMRKYGP